MLEVFETGFRELAQSAGSLLVGGIMEEELAVEWVWILAADKVWVEEVARWITEWLELLSRK